MSRALPFSAEWASADVVVVLMLMLTLKRHICLIAWLSLCFILERSWVALYSDVCQCVCQASVTPDQISTFSNIYRHTSPLLTIYHLISSSTNLYWPSTSQYRDTLTQYHQVPLITYHLMSYAQYTWSSFFYSSASSSKTKRDIGMGPMGKMMPTYRATNALLTKSGCGAFLTVFCLPEVGRCQ